MALQSGAIGTSLNSSHPSVTCAMIKPNQTNPNQNKVFLKTVPTSHAAWTFSLESGFLFLSTMQVFYGSILLFCADVMILSLMDLPQYTFIVCEAQARASSQ